MCLFKVEDTNICRYLKHAFRYHCRSLIASKNKLIAAQSFDSAWLSYWIISSTIAFHLTQYLGDPTQDLSLWQTGLLGSSGDVSPSTIYIYITVSPCNYIYSPVSPSNYIYISYYILQSHLSNICLLHFLYPLYIVFCLFSFISFISHHQFGILMFWSQAFDLNICNFDCNHASTFVQLCRYYYLIISVQFIWFSSFFPSYLF